MNTLLFLWLSFVTIFSSVKSSVLVRGDNKKESFTFANPVVLSAYHASSRYLFTSASQPIENNHFTVAVINPEQNSFWGLTPENVTLNHQENQPNPLCGATIQHLALFGTLPAVITHQEPTKVYLFNNYVNLSQISLLSSADLPEVHLVDPITKVVKKSKTCGGIIGLATNSPKESDPRISCCFAVVKNNQGFFGPAGSGIVVLSLKEAFLPNPDGSMQQEKKGYFLVPEYGIPIENITKYLTQDALISYLNEPLNLPVVLHWNERLQMLYAGFCLLTDKPKKSSAIAIMAGTQACMPVHTVTKNAIIGSTESEQEIFIHHIKSMATSTDLDYLIVAGGADELKKTKNRLYAFPLINSHDDHYMRFYGTIAAKNAPVVDEFLPAWPYRFLNRTLQQPIEKETDFYDKDDPEILVGASSLPGDIEDVFVQTDAVFAVVNGDKPGVYHSQALFDHQGKIINWTSWQHLHQEITHKSALDWQTGSLWFLKNNDDGCEIRHTCWSKGIDQWLNPVEQFFARPERGVHHCLQIANSPLCTEDLFVLTGLKKCMILKNKALGKPLESHNGTFLWHDQASSVAIDGAALHEMGSIITAAWYQKEHQAWLFLGGNGGLGVFAHDNGDGVERSGAAFQKIGNYRHVRKLIIHEDYLYILTNEKLDKIALDNNVLKSADEQITVAHRDAMPVKTGSFNDVVIFDNGIVLATNAGVFKNPVSGVENQRAWQQIFIHESPANIIKLLNIHSADNAQRCSNLYLIAGNGGAHQSRIYRFYVHADDRNNFAVEQIPDCYAYGQPSFYFNFASYHNNFATNGATTLVSRNFPTLQTAGTVVQVLPPELGTGKRFTMPNGSSLMSNNDAHFISGLTQRLSDGAWMITGDFGARINE